MQYIGLELETSLLHLGISLVTCLLDKRATSVKSPGPSILFSKQEAKQTACSLSLSLMTPNVLKLLIVIQYYSNYCIWLLETNLLQFPILTEKNIFLPRHNSTTCIFHFVQFPQTKPGIQIQPSPRFAPSRIPASATTIQAHALSSVVVAPVCLWQTS